MIGFTFGIVDAIHITKIDGSLKRKPQGKRKRAARLVAMKHLLRCLGKNRLRPQGVTLYNERPRLMTIQNGVCGCINEAFCPKTPLINDGKATHLDHIITVNVFADKVM